jgi:hypothetical protein
MFERYAFPLRYDDAEMNAAVNAYVARALFTERPALAFGPLALVGLSLAMLAYAGEGQSASLLFALALFVLGVFVSGGWRMHRRAMHELVKAAQGKFCFAHLYDEGLVIETGVPAPMLAWTSIKAVWPAGKVLLLILATNRFVALPVAAASQEALEFLREKVAAGATPRDLAPS